MPNAIPKISECEIFFKILPHLSLLLPCLAGAFNISLYKFKKYAEWRRDSRRALSAHFGLVVRLRSQTHGRLPLRRKDIAFERMQIVVREGKGEKHRCVPLPQMIIPKLLDQLEFATRQLQSD